MSEKEKKSQSEFAVSANIIKNSVKSSFKAHKAAWIVGIVLLILLILIGIAGGLLRNQTISTRVIVSMLPKQIHLEQDDYYSLDFYKETNEEYFDTDPDERGTMYPLNIYYYDESGEKVYLDECTYIYTDDSGNEQKVNVNYAFVLEGGEKIVKIVPALKIAAGVLAAAIVIVAIFIWYRYDKKQYQKNKPKTNRKSKKN